MVVPNYWKRVFEIGSALNDTGDFVYSSGFAVTKDSVLTCLHGITVGRPVEVRCVGSEYQAAELEYYKLELDLALLRVGDLTKLQPIPLKKTDEIDRSCMTYSIGNYDDLVGIVHPIRIRKDVKGGTINLETFAKSVPDVPVPDKSNRHYSVLSDVVPDDEIEDDSPNLPVILYDPYVGYQSKPGRSGAPLIQDEQVIGMHMGTIKLGLTNPCYGIHVSVLRFFMKEAFKARKAARKATQIAARKAARKAWKARKAARRGGEKEMGSERKKKKSRDSDSEQDDRKSKRRKTERIKEF